jgi:hypothetical protein
VGRIRRHLTYSNVMVTLLAFIVLGGGAYAAFHLPKNSVRSRNIKNGQVKKPDLVKPAAVKSAGLAADTTGDCSATPNEWVSGAPDVGGPVGYYRDVDGIVHLTGKPLQCGTPPSDTIFSLPPGYRPARSVGQLILLEPSSAVGLSIRASTGGVRPSSSSNLDLFSLDGVSFRCGPSGHNGCP